MNEEDLKVVITADTSKYDAGISKAKSTLKDFTDENSNAGKAVNTLKGKLDGFQKSIGGIDKALSAVLKGIAGVVTAVIGLSKATEELRVNQAKLNSAFRAVGASANTAQNTYQGLYRVLGDDDRSVEAANHLAKITTNERDLAEWTQICEGVFATFGDSLPIEGLTESANETIRVGKVTGVLADALNWAGVNEDAFNAQLAETSSLEEREQLLRGTLNGLYMQAAGIYEEENRATIELNEAHARLNQTLAQLGAVCTPAVTSIINLANAILQALKPAIEVVSLLIQLTAEAISNLFGLNMALGGTSSSFKPVAKSIDKSAYSANKFAGSMAGAAGSAKEIKKSLAGFDELNIVSEENIGGLGGGVHLPEVGGEGFNAGLDEMNGLLPNVNENLGGFNKATAWIEEHHDGIVTALELIVGAIVAFKAIKGISTLVGHVSGAFKTLGSVLGSVGYVGIITGIVAATVGLIAIVKDADDAMSGLSEKEKEVIRKADEAHTSFMDILSQTEERDANILAEKQRIDGLVEELDTLVDANGRVKDGNEDRVNYILGELKEATGKEYELIDGEIQHYSDLKDEVYEVINAQTAKALLESHREAYLQALENEGEAATAVALAQKDYNEQVTKTKPLWDAYIESENAVIAKQKELDQAYEDGDIVRINILEGEMADLKKVQNERWTAWGEENRELERRGEVLQNAKDNYKDYYDEVNNYEQAVILAKQGRTAEAIELLTAEGEAYQALDENITESESKILESMAKTAADASSHAAEVRENWENGVDGYTEEMVLEAEQAAEDAYGAWEDAYETAKGVGDNLGNGLIDGLNGTKYNFMTQAGNFIAAGIGVMRQRAEIASPSKKTKRFGKYLGEGLEIGLKDTEEQVKKASERLTDVSLKPLETDLRVASFDTKISVEDTLRSNYKQSQLDYHSDISRLGQILASRQDKVVISIDGKELGWATIKSINDITHQTGNLQLAIV